MTLSRRYSYRGRARSYLSASCPIPPRFTAGFFSFAKASFTLAGGRQDRHRHRPRLPRPLSSAVRRGEQRAPVWSVSVLITERGARDVDGGKQRERTVAPAACRAGCGRAAARAGRPGDGGARRLRGARGSGRRRSRRGSTPGSTSRSPTRPWPATLTIDAAAEADCMRRYERVIGRLAGFIQVKAPRDSRLPGSTDEALVGGDRRPGRGPHPHRPARPPRPSCGRSWSCSHCCPTWASPRRSAGRIRWPARAAKRLDSAVRLCSYSDTAFGRQGLLGSPAAALVPGSDRPALPWAATVHVRKRHGPGALPALSGRLRAVGA